MTMKYYLKTMDGAQIEIDEGQRAKIRAALKAGQKWVTVNGCDINSAGIGGIYDASVFAHKESSGVLRDGTAVIRKFGIWQDATNPNVTLDLNYYPELASDRVMPRSQYRQLLEEGMPPAMIGEKYDTLTSGNERKTLASGRKEVTK